MKICPKCNEHHSKSGTFCSRKCANSRVWSDADKLKKSIALIGVTPKCTGKSIKIARKCINCDLEFKCYPSSTKFYCTTKCNPNCGGYRAGSGRAKTGYYKGIYCGSTYELCWIIYQLDHNLPFERFDGYLEFEGKKYFPDFLQYGKIVELKGYELQEYVDIKNNIATQNGYEVIVLRKNDLTKEFEWVKEHYSLDFKSLYDDYRPKYSYICHHCGNEYHRDFKLKSQTIFCSRVCAGSGHLGRKKKRGSIPRSDANIG
jgi:hypothetical protein